MNKLIYTAAIMGICLSACHKDRAEPVDPPALTGDSIYLDKFYYVFSIAGVMDTGGIASFYYDNQKRVQSFSTYVAESSPEPRISDSGRLYYQGADTVPYKVVITYYQNGLPGSNSMEKYFYYDNQNRKVKDSTSELYGARVNEKTVRTFTYDNNKVYGHMNHTHFNIPANSGQSRDTATIAANGNILSNKKYIYDGTNYVFSIKSDLTYDKYHSPFSKGSLYVMFWNFPDGETLEFGYASKNNILSQTEIITYPSPYSFQSNFSYQYTTAGFPKRSAKAGEQFHYTYKAL